VKREPGDGAISALEGRGRNTGRQIDEQLRLGEGASSGGAQTDTGRSTICRRDGQQLVGEDTHAVHNAEIHPLVKGNSKGGTPFEGAGKIPLMKKPALASDEQSPLVRRIHERLEALETNATAVSLSASDNKDLLRDILNGRTKNPRTDTIRKIAEALGTTVEWLMEGDGEPAPVPLAGRPTSNLRMAGVKLPALAGLARDVPVMGTAAGSLAGAFQFEGGVVDYVARPPALVGAKNAYSMYVDGNSMAPEHNSGDLRFVHPDRKVHIGDSVVVTAKYSEHGPYESFIKRLVRRTGDRIIVEQLNPPATIEFDLRFVASVHKVLTMNDLFGV